MSQCLLRKRLEKRRYNVSLKHCYQVFMVFAAIVFVKRGRDIRMKCYQIVSPKYSKQVKMSTPQEI